MKAQVYREKPRMSLLVEAMAKAEGVKESVIRRQAVGFYISLMADKHPAIAALAQEHAQEEFESCLTEIQQSYGELAVAGLSLDVHQDSSEIRL